MGVNFIVRDRTPVCPTTLVEDALCLGDAVLAVPTTFDLRRLFGSDHGLNVQHGEV